MQSLGDRQTAALANYKVRESSRAKNVHLKITPSGGLQVVVPQGFDCQKIPEILQKKQNWIEKVSQRLIEQRQRFDLNSSESLPTQIFLRAINEVWEIQYCPGSGSQMTAVEQSPQKLLISGNVDCIETCKAVLQKWLIHKARLHLTPWLRRISQEIHLPFLKTSVRGQKTRWASCSRQKVISLNCKLLFLPPALVRYVFIHELCHTVHLNHSPKFWHLVQEKEPLYKQLDMELRNACCYVPLWLEQ